MDEELRQKLIDDMDKAVNALLVAETCLADFDLTHPGQLSGVDEVKRDKLLSILDEAEKREKDLTEMLQTDRETVVRWLAREHRVSSLSNRNPNFSARTMAGTEPRRPIVYFKKR